MKGKNSTSFPWQDLLKWHELHGRHHLPWRNYTHPEILYRVWISEILLQQTQVDRVVPYLEKILAKYPSIHDLAGSSYEEFFPYYQGMGYYSRARNILRTAKIVSTEYAGVFPMDKKLLQKLPGVGGYTSSAILAFGYGEPHLAWDTNLEKVFARYYNGRRDMKLSEEQKEKIEEEFRIFVKKPDDNNLSGFGGGNLSKNSSTKNNIQEEFSNDDESNNAVEQSEGGVSFSSTNSFGTFATKSTENGVGKVQKEGIGMDSHLCGNDRNTGFPPMREGQEQKSLVRAINNALMDFASLMDLKNPDNIDWENYPIKRGLFYETGGSLEPREEKKSRTFPIPDATVIVILHQDHRDYYIPHYSDTYTPFVLTPALHRDTRLYVQEYFRRFHFLEVSVRPVHAKWLATDGRAYIAVNAQIQAGDRQQFQKTDKKTAQEVLKKMIP